jgi:hypothetical protein
VGGKNGGWFLVVFFGFSGGGAWMALWWEKNSRELARGLVNEIGGIRESLEMALHVHGTSKVLDDRDSLDVQIAEHGVTLPSAQQADEIIVDVGSDEGHGISGVEGLDGDVGWVMAQKSGGLVQVDGSGWYMELAPPKLVIVTVDRGWLRWGHVVPEVKNAPRKGMDGAEDVVTASSMTNFIAPICILLVGEYEHAEGCGVELVVHGSVEVKFEGAPPQGCKDLEEVDGVWDVPKGRILAEGETEAGPNVPGVIAPITVFSSDAGDSCCL